jgi:ParB-like chromosome segregation protein Spo0J
VTVLSLDLESLPVVEARVDALSPGFSPRLAGEDEGNVRLLAEVDGPLPPLLVHRTTNRVIDGMHRLLVARLRGAETVNVRYYDGDAGSAFVLAVQANVAHGLPLSLSDRKAAAQRIVDAYPDWSDRRVADIAGLSDKTVAGIRRTQGRHPGEVAERREGNDGRRRPIDASSRRAEVTRILAESPDSSLRRVAERAGVSPETVRSIRARLAADREGTGRRSAAGTPTRGLDPQQSLQVLLRDPAFRSTDSGRTLLRVLSTLTLLGGDHTQLVHSVPAHDLDQFRRLALAHAEIWRSLAEQAAERESHTPEASRGEEAMSA